jgi:hypothetical protein
MTLLTRPFKHSIIALQLGETCGPAITYKCDPDRQTPAGEVNEIEHSVVLLHRTLLCFTFLSPTSPLTTMPPKVENLEPLIRKILTAPGVDMTSVTAKDVRKQLVKMDSSISEEYLKEHKDEVKELITNIFHSIQEAASSKKRERDSDEDGDNSEEEEAPKPSQKKKTKTKASKSAEDDDAEIARKLSKEINGNGGRSTRQAAPPKKSAGTKRSKKKSAETINSGDEEDAPKKRAARGGFAKEYALRWVEYRCPFPVSTLRALRSAPLAAVVGTDVLARTQVCC